MRRGYSFRPRGWPLALAALACLAFIALGNWQSRRADAKRALAQELDAAARAAPLELAPGPLDARALAHKHVVVRGRFVPEGTVLLANRLRHGRTGYEVIAPFKLGDSQWHVLVNRGWVAAPASPGEIAARTPDGTLAIDGVVLERLSHALEAGTPTRGSIRQNLDIAAFGTESGLPLEPFAIEQHSDTGDGLARDWPRADLGIEKNESYALQWYTFAALAIVAAVAFSFRRAPRA
jgi:surfeit locus 1 family protein